MPISNHAYISALSSNSVTISGPPATLAQFFETSTTFTSERLALPVFGPYHAHHLHQGVDAREFLQVANPKTTHILATYRLAQPLMSTSSGECFDEKLDAPSLLAAVIDDILKQPLQLSKVVNGFTCAVKASSYQECSIISFGPNSSESMVAKVLESETEADIVILEGAPSQIPMGLTSFGDMSRTSKKPKLAIVGMAGRFPNAADHEKFWDLLEAGLDVHRRVS